MQDALMKTRDGKSSKSSGAPFEFWPGHCSTYAVARLFWIALGPAALMILCVLRMDADRSNVLFLTVLYCLTVLAMLTTRWISFLNVPRDRQLVGDDWKHATGFSVIAITLSLAIWTVAQTVSEAQTATSETAPVESKSPMLTEDELFTQTL